MDCVVDLGIAQVTLSMNWVRLPWRIHGAVGENMRSWELVV